MRKYKLEPIFKIYNNWSNKDFALGFHLQSEDTGSYRDYYIIISLVFWQIYLGFSK